MTSLSSSGELWLEQKASDFSLMYCTVADYSKEDDLRAL